jgi:hypothetical protein
MLAMEAFLWLRERFSAGDPPPVEDAIEVLEAARACANLGMADPEFADESGKVLGAIEQNLEALTAHPGHEEIAVLEGLQRDYTSMMEQAGAGIATEAQFTRVRASLRKLEAKAHDAASVVRSAEGKEALARFGSLLAERRREVDTVAASIETAHEIDRVAEPYLNRLNRSVQQLGQHPVGSAGFLDVLGEILRLRQEVEDERARPGADRGVLDRVLATCDAVLSQVAAATGADRGPTPSPGKKRHWWSR